MSAVILSFTTISASSVNGDVENNRDRKVDSAFRTRRRDAFTPPQSRLPGIQGVGLQRAERAVGVGVGDAAQAIPA